MNKSPDPTPTMAYSNISRVSTTPEEVVLEFGIRPLDQWESPSLTPHTHIAMSLPAAKRLAIALGRALKDYEKAFGTIDTDVARKRAQG